jgi:protease secretion system membrane fusion protein
MNFFFTLLKKIKTSLGSLSDRILIRRDENYYAWLTLLKKIKTSLGSLSDRILIRRDENYYAWLGMQILVWGFGGLILWACFAPLDKGVSAPGYVITDSNRKAVQPAFNGIIEEIMVREGQAVKAGEVLVKLNPTNALAQSNATRQSIQGLELQVKGLRDSIIQKKQQQKSLDEQLKGVRELVAQGYMARNRMLELDRSYLQLSSSILEDEGNLLKIDRQIAELQERLGPFDFDLVNTELKSPVDGQVVNIKVFTKGGFVGVGTVLMEVIPIHESLIIEAQLPVHLVDRVYPNLPVEMLFTAFNANRTPHIPGLVISVGADRLQEEKTGVPYYKVQVRATPEGARMLGNLKIRPGMPVEIFVKLGEQTLMTYLLKPVFDRMHSAMREY